MHAAHSSTLTFAPLDVRQTLGTGSGIIGQVDSSEIQTAFDDVFDQAMVFHGFADYMRDYDVFVYATSDPRTGIPPQHLRYRFTHCVKAVITTALSPEIWKRSIDERLTDYEQGRDLDGYVWGVKWQELYPGMRLVPDSAEARQWSRELGLPFHDASIKANAHNLSLVFSDLTVQTVQPGCAPFLMPDGEPDFKAPRLWAADRSDVAHQAEPDRKTRHCQASTAPDLMNAKTRGNLWQNSPPPQESTSPPARSIASHNGSAERTRSSAVAASTSSTAHTAAMTSRREPAGKTSSESRSMAERHTFSRSFSARVR